MVIVTPDWRARPGILQCATVLVGGVSRPCMGSAGGLAPSGHGDAAGSTTREGGLDVNRRLRVECLAAGLLLLASVLGLVLRSAESAPSPAITASFVAAGVRAGWDAFRRVQGMVVVLDYEVKRRTHDASADAEPSRPVVVSMTPSVQWYTSLGRVAVYQPTEEITVGGKPRTRLDWAKNVWNRDLGVSFSLTKQTVLGDGTGAGQGSTDRTWFSGTVSDLDTAESDSRVRDGVVAPAADPRELVYSLRPFAASLDTLDRVIADGKANTTRVEIQRQQGRRMVFLEIAVPEKKARVEWWLDPEHAFVMRRYRLYVEGKQSSGAPVIEASTSPELWEGAGVFLPRWIEYHYWDGGTSRTTITPVLCPVPPDIFEPLFPPGARIADRTRGSEFRVLRQDTERPAKD